MFCVFYLRFGLNGLKQDRTDVLMALHTAHLAVLIDLPGNHKKTATSAIKANKKIPRPQRTAEWMAGSASHTKGVILLMELPVIKLTPELLVKLNAIAPAITAIKGMKTKFFLALAFRIPFPAFFGTAMSFCIKFSSNIPICHESGLIFKTPVLNGLVEQFSE